MPHPRATELAADRIARLLTALDESLLEYAVTGRQPPSADRLLDRIDDLVATAVLAAFLDIDPTATMSDPRVQQAIAVQMTSVAQYVQNARNDAAALATEVAAAQVDDDGTPLTDMVRDFGIGAALSILARRVRRPNRNQVARIVRLARRRQPRQSSARARMAVRTGTAIARNRYAADIVDERNTIEPVPAGGARPGEWAIYVEDARLGPTDEPCEDVDGRWATPRWLRANPVEHPNCTRRGRPRRLPAGAAVTLLD